MWKRILWAVLLAGALLLGAMGGSVFSTNAGPLPDNCTKERGTVTCSTTEGPGKNQGGVGTTETVETKGNTTNKSPEEPQDLEDECDKKPPKAQGDPIGECSV